MSAHSSSLTKPKGPVPLVLRGRSYGGGHLPAICVPLLAADEDALVDELRAVLREDPDVVEWRADYFDLADDAVSVARVATRLRAELGDRPLIFTLRAPLEGGHRDVPKALDVYREICAAGVVDAIDVECSRPAGFLESVKVAARENGVLTICSFHDFLKTPDKASMTLQLARMAGDGAGAAKLAVMPRSSEDVTALMNATLEASAVSCVPVITMSMGELGMRSRCEGWKWGSALTFAAGMRSSAPGQIPVAALRAGIHATASTTSVTDNAR